MVQVMELVKLVVLAVFAAQCHSQGSGDNMTNMTNMTMETNMTMGPNTTVPQPDIIQVDITRAYRFNDPDVDGTTYQAVYQQNLYNYSAPYRYAHYNVSIVTAL